MEIVMIITETLQTGLLNKPLITYRLILPSVCEKTCLWLHGYQERSENLLQHYDFEGASEKYKIAFLFPDVPDSYYLDQTWNHCYTETFLMSEFLPTVTERHQLPSTLWIGGISMGGFGSLLLGSHYSDRFRRILCISGAFIIDDILIGNPEVTGNFQNNAAHFQNIFGEVSSLSDSGSRNPEIAAYEALESKQLPPIFMSCGTEDLLFVRNVRLKNRLDTSGAEITWAEYPGNHCWDCFIPALNEAFQWADAEIDSSIISP